MSFEPRDYLRHILAEANYLIDHSAGLSTDRFMADDASSEKQRRRYRTISEDDIRLLKGVG